VIGYASSMAALIPPNVRWIPNAATRAENRRRLAPYDSSHFKRYSDYFFFLHFDPVQRFWHAVGMWVGIGLFGMIWAWRDRPLAALGIFAVGFVFFYGFGLFSHLAYDGGAAKTEPGHFLDSMPTVIYINVLSTTGLYQRRLRAFVAEYPFTAEAYGLLPKPAASARARRRVAGTPPTTPSPDAATSARANGTRSTV